VERERAVRMLMNFMVAKVEGIKNGTTGDE
jgi:hypothetical protein